MNENTNTKLRKELINLTYRIMVLLYMLCSLICGLLMIKYSNDFSSIIGASPLAIGFVGAATAWYSLFGVSSCPQIIESIQKLNTSFNLLVNQILHR